MILMAVLLVLVFNIFPCIYRAAVGPRVWDRVIAINVVGTKSIVVLALISFVLENPLFLDIALVYALLNFAATIALSKYVEHSTL